MLYFQSFSSSVQLNTVFQIFNFIIFFLKSRPRKKYIPVKTCTYDFLLQQNSNQIRLLILQQLVHFNWDKRFSNQYQQFQYQPRFYGLEFCRNFGNSQFSEFTSKSHVCISGAGELEWVSVSSRLMPNAQSND